MTLRAFSTDELLRYHTLVTKMIDSRHLPELRLSDGEWREPESFRLTASAPDPPNDASRTKRGTTQNDERPRNEE